MKKQLVESIFSFATAVFLLLAFTRVVNNLDVSYYTTIHRVTLSRIIQISLTGSQEGDLMLLFLVTTIVAVCTITAFAKERRNRKWFLGPGLVLAACTLFALDMTGWFELLSVLGGVACLILLIRGLKRDLGKFAWITARYLILILIALEAAALARWITYPFYPTEMYQDWTWTFARTETQLFYLPSVAGPLLMLLVLLAWPVRPIAEFYIGSLRSSLSRLVKDKSPPSTAIESNEKQVPPRSVDGLEKQTRRVNPDLIFLLAVIFVIALTLYPYYPGINPESTFVGVDLVYYNSWLKEIIGRTPGGALEYVFRELQGGSRPFHMLILYCIQVATRVSTETIVKAQLTVLAPFFVISVYYFTLAGTKEKSMASLAALIAASSYSITVGMYAAFASNLLALALSFVVLAVYLNSLDERWHARSLMVVMVLTVGLLFTYVWAWIGVLAILVAHEVMTTARTRGFSKVRIQRLAAILLVNLAADLAKSYFFQSSARDIAAQALASGKISPLNIANLWDNLIFVFRYYVGGYYTNIPLLILAVIGAFYCLKKNTAWSDMLTAWMLSAVIPTIIGSFALQSHIFFSLPIPVLAAVAVHFVSQRVPENIVQPLASFLLLINANYSLRSIANLV